MQKKYFVITPLIDTITTSYHKKMQLKIWNRFHEEIG